MISPKAGTRFVTGNRILDSIQGDREQLGRRMAAMPLVSGVLVPGEYSATAPNKFTDGVLFAGNETKDVFTGLGRPPVGFVVCDVQSNEAAIKRETSGLTKGLANSHIRLTNLLANPVSVKLLVF